MGSNASIGEINASIALLINQGSVKLAKEQMISAVREGVEGSKIHFEKLESYLSAAIAKADPGAQLMASFTKVAGAMGRGTFTDSMTQELKRLERAWLDVGNTAAASMAKQAQGINRYALTGSTLDVHPSWAASRSADWNRRLHVAMGQEDFNARMAAKYNAQQLGNGPLDIGTNSAGMNFDPDKRQRILGHALRYEEQDRSRAERLAMHAAKRSIARQEERLAFWGRDNPDDGFLDSSVRSFGPIDASMSHRGRASLAVRDYLLDNYRPTPGMLSRPVGGFNSHNARFASQNLAFGIDDAIQSYHYGGIGASMRAASNNLTAIAGMGISNPAVAAGTVVALSIATAALPVMLKHIGINQTDLAGAAKLRYDRKGDIEGAQSRGLNMISHVEKASSDLLDLLDDRQEDNRKRIDANKELARYKGPNNPFWQPGSFLHRRASNFMTAGAAAKFDAAYAFLDADEKNEPVKRTALQMQIDRLRGINTAPGFANAEFLSSAHSGEAAFRSNATTLSAFEASIRRDAQAEISVVLSGNVGRRGGRVSLEQQAQIAVIEARRDQQLSTREANMAQVKENQYRLHGMTYAYSSGNGLDTAFTSFRDRKRSIDQMPGLSQEMHERLTHLNRGQYNNEMFASYSQQHMANLGLNSSIAALSLDRQIKYNGYMQSVAAGSMSEEAAGALIMASNRGFRDNRRRLIEDMTNRHQIQTPVGEVASAFRREVDNLQREFRANNLDDLPMAKRQELETNLKQQLALQLRDARTPAGIQRFMAEASGVGSATDRELQTRVLGHFAATDKVDDFRDKTLQQLADMLTELQEINNKVKVAEVFGGAK